MHQAGNYITGMLRSLCRTVLLRCKLVPAGFAHDKVKRARLDLSKPPVPVQRNSDRNRRVVPFELHPASDQEIVQLVDVERLARLAQKQSAGLRNGSVCESMADRFDVVGSAGNAAAILVDVRYRAGGAITRRRL